MPFKQSFALLTALNRLTIGWLLTRQFALLAEQMTSLKVIMGNMLILNSISSSLIPSSG